MKITHQVLNIRAVISLLSPQEGGEPHDGGNYVASAGRKKALKTLYH